MNLPRLPLLVGSLVLLSVAAILSGCVTNSTELTNADLDEGAPYVETILDDLARTDAEIVGFRSSVKFILESPDLKASQRLRGMVKYRRPHDLYVEGRHHITGIALFKLMCVGDEFLMEFPGNRQNSFYQLTGNDYENVPFSVSPSAIAAEMFFPEDWVTIDRRTIRMIGYDSVTHIATLDIREREVLRRRVTVRRVQPSDPRWVIVRNERYGENGVLIAETTLEEYESQDGIIFPTVVEAKYPTENTRLYMKMPTIRPNEKISDETFDIQGRARELRLL